MLKELSEICGVSGQEDEVRERIIQAIEGLGCDYRVDALGNLLTVKRAAGKGKQRTFKVMIAAHMDEVGLMITHVEKDGFLRFMPVGGLDDRILLAKRVVIGADKVPGVIGLKPIHLLKAEERQQVVKVEQMNIDIGASNKEEAEKLVKIGDGAAFTTTFLEMEAAKGVDDLRIVRGKAFDDRVGCALLVELLKEDYPFELHAAFTVQEEVGLRGAQVAAYAIKPDVAFVLEGTICDDLPKKEDVTPFTRLGHGAAISTGDRSFIPARGLVRLLIDTAEEEGLPYQLRPPGAGGTDAGAISLSREGVPSAVVSVPCRYLHAPASLLSLRDFDHTLELMRAALPCLKAEIIRIT